MKNNSFCPSVMSMKEKMESLEFKGMKLCVIEYPGHRRLRGQVADFYPLAKSIVFLLDSADKSSFREAAAYLFDLLTAPALQHRSDLALLIVCNKSDMDCSLSVDAVEQALCKEL